MTDKDKDRIALEEAAIEALESMLSDQGEAPDNEGPSKHTLLEVWTAVLANIEKSMESKVTMQEAMKVINEWPKISVQEVPAYHWAYHSNLLMFRRILEEEISSDSKCFKHIEDDAVRNKHHYLNLLLAWQIQSMEWEVNWDAKTNDAHIWLAAHVDSVNMILGQKGLIGHLDQIDFELSDDDQEKLTEALMEAAESLSPSAE